MMDKPEEHFVNTMWRMKMTALDFEKLSRYIYHTCGIKMPPAKKILLECRLQKRLAILGMPSFSEYLKFVFSEQGRQGEVAHMIDAITTNKTDFFREPVHFDFLTKHALPGFCRNAHSHSRQLKVWSAGCSSGMEAYSLAMTFDEFEKTSPLNYGILGTDISTRMLSDAARGIYDEESIAGIPLAMKRKYFLKSKDRINKTVRIIPPIRAKVRFQYLNLMDDDFGEADEFHLIFCRNVLIYFDRATQEKVLLKLSRKLKPQGFLFLGHSESVLDMRLPLTQVKSTILQKLE
jgi:chemotaxis protein methyltransferase CheR